MKKLKEKLNRTWKWLNGKKTFIGGALHLAWAVVHLTVPATKPFAEIGHSGIFLLTGVGLGHKTLKLLNK